MAAKAVEVERAYLSFADSMSFQFWGDEPVPARRRLVTVPRSLRRYFGRTVEALPGRRGRREKRPRRPNRRAPPFDPDSFRDD